MYRSLQRPKREPGTLERSKIVKLIPFGEVLEERVKLARDHNLIEQKWSLTRMTERARKYYEPISFIEYLQGKVEHPQRLLEIFKQPGTDKETPQAKQNEIQAPRNPTPTQRQLLIEQICSY